MRGLVIDVPAKGEPDSDSTKPTLQKLDENAKGENGHLDQALQNTNQKKAAVNKMANGVKSPGKLSNANADSSPASRFLKKVTKSSLSPKQGKTANSVKTQKSPTTPPQNGTNSGEKQEQTAMAEALEATNGSESQHIQVPDIQSPSTPQDKICSNRFSEQLDGSASPEVSSDGKLYQKGLRKGEKLPPRRSLPSPLRKTVAKTRLGDNGAIKRNEAQLFDAHSVSENGAEDTKSEIRAASPGRGPYLLKLARASHLAGDSPFKTMDYASRAAKFFEHVDSKPSLELVLCLHILAAGYCRLGKYEEAVPVLERSLGMPNVEEGPEHALAAYAGYMQLGDTHYMLGFYEKALSSYHNALEVQKKALGNTDTRVAETCRYIAEAHLQVMQFNEAKELCEHVLLIHREHSPAGSVEEATDRRLMALICSAKTDHETALEHLILASTALNAHGQDADVASVDCSIGEEYLALGRYDEAIFSYQKALTVFKSINGENHASVASVYVSLADISLRTGKQREAKTFCESAVRIFGKHGAGHVPDDLASGLVEVASIYEAMNEREQALCLLRKALDILKVAPGEQSAAAGVEAQMGVLLYMLGKYSEAYAAFKNSTKQLRAGTEKTTLLGILLNQMGLASIELYQIPNAVALFEEARSILEGTIGPHHPDTLAVCSNLAGAYDALGRVDDSIKLLESVLEVKEEDLGTVHPDVEHERQRLMFLLKEVGRSRMRKTNTLEDLLSLPNSEKKYQGLPI